mmetsp:Transcript_143264/g.445314  ORF Transcript_143264/g.445314 Transcript_143264/m.445314 type:complete len:270 (-) Transcript_143264:500-1309(-)
MCSGPKRVLVASGKSEKKPPMQKKMAESHSPYLHGVTHTKGSVASMAHKAVQDPAMAMRKDVRSPTVPQAIRPKPLSSEARPVRFVKVSSETAGKSSRPKVFWEAAMINTTCASQKTVAMRSQKCRERNIWPRFMSTWLCLTTSAFLGDLPPELDSSESRELPPSPSAGSSGSKSITRPKNCIPANMRPSVHRREGTWSKTLSLMSGLCQSKNFCPPTSNRGMRCRGLIHSSCTLLKTKAPAPKPATTMPEARPLFFGSHFIRTSMGTM